MIMLVVMLSESCADL